MATAFKCDRCGEFGQGNGMKAVGVETAWNPDEHSYKCMVAINITWFEDGAITDGRHHTKREHEAQLCKSCYRVVVALAIESLRA